MTDLSDLIARVRSATGPDRRLDAEISCAFYFPDLRPAEPDDFLGVYGYTPGNIKVKHGFLMAGNFTSSLDAAIELCERVLPNARIKFDFDDSYARAEIWQGRGYAREKFLALHEDPNGEAALALTLAVLLAKQEIEQ